MKIKIPFKLFGNQEGELILEIPVNSVMLRRENQETVEKIATVDAKGVARYLGAFKDEFQRRILGYERCPGIENVFDTLRLCDEDDVLRERILELKREAREEYLSRDKSEDKKEE